MSPPHLEVGGTHGRHGFVQVSAMIHINSISARVVGVEMGFRRNNPGELQSSQYKAFV